MLTITFTSFFYPSFGISSTQVIQTDSKMLSNSAVSQKERFTDVVQKLSWTDPYAALMEKQHCTATAVTPQTWPLTPKKRSILPMGGQGLSRAKAPWEQLSETEGAQWVSVPQLFLFLEREGWGSRGFISPFFLFFFNHVHTFSRHNLSKMPWGQFSVKINQEGESHQGNRTLICCQSGCAVCQ